MAKGFERPPGWAVAVLAAGVLTLGGLTAFSSGRHAPDPLTPAQAARLSAGLAAPAPDTRPVVTRPKAIRSVLVLGDSLSTGAGVLTPAAGYVGDLQRMFPGDWNVQATPTATVDSAFGSATFPADADAVIVELGTNDWNAETPTAFGPRYTTRLTGLRKRYPHALLVCVGVWQNQDDPKTGGYDQQIGRTCQQIRGQFVRISDLFASSHEHQVTGNRFHPNDIGYANIADRVATAIRGS